jgi:hypothetical protein
MQEEKGKSGTFGEDTCAQEGGMILHLPAPCPRNRILVAFSEILSAVLVEVQ